MSKILGIDVSRWQANIDYEKVKASNIQFVIPKAGEVVSGNEWDDPLYGRNMTEGRKYGLVTGAYYYFHPAVGASQQARHFIRLMDSYGYPDLPPAIDVETTDGLSPAICANVLYSMIDYLQKELGRKPIIYTRNGFWVNQYGNPAYSKDYKFWLAQYPLIDPITEPFKFAGKMAGTSPGVNPIIWQFTEKMRLPGLPMLDGNWWLGTQEEFDAMVSVEEPQPEEPDEEPRDMYIEITANFLRLRHEPKLYEPPTLIVEKGQRLLVLNDGVQGDGIIWYKVAIPDEYGLAYGYISANGKYSKQL